MGFLFPSGGGGPGSDTTAWHDGGDTGHAGTIGTLDATDFVAQANGADRIAMRAAASAVEVADLLTGLSDPDTGFRWGGTPDELVVEAGGTFAGTFAAGQFLAADNDNVNAPDISFDAFRTKGFFLFGGSSDLTAANGSGTTANAVNFPYSGGLRIGFGGHSAKLTFNHVPASYTASPMIVSNQGAGRGISLISTGVQVSVNFPGDPGVVFNVNNESVQITGRVAANPVSTPNNTLDVTPGAHTSLPASVEYQDLRFRGRTLEYEAGAIPEQKSYFFESQTYAFDGASTITDAATLVIEGNPIAGANATLTNAYALWVQGGDLRLDTSTDTTVGAAGAGDALPASPDTYLVVNIAGTNKKIPLFAA